MHRPGLPGAIGTRNALISFRPCCVERVKRATLAVKATSAFVEHCIDLLCRLWRLYHYKGQPVELLFACFARWKQCHSSDCYERLRKFCHDSQGPEKTARGHRKRKAGRERWCRTDSRPPPLSLTHLALLALSTSREQLVQCSSLTRLINRVYNDSLPFPWPL